MSRMLLCMALVMYEYERIVVVVGLVFFDETDHVVLLDDEL